MKFEVKNWKEMPGFMKLFAVLSVIAFLSNVWSLLFLAPIEYSFFGTDFPKNYKLIWYLYSTFYSGWGTAVLFQRSYTFLKKYIITSVFIMSIYLLNNIYWLLTDISQETLVVFIIYLGFTFLPAFFLWYLSKQRSYFNEL